MRNYNNFIVNIGKLQNNAVNIKNHIGSNCKFCAVVKANAYGIGIETVCKSLYGIADFFACACLKEALSIRVFDKVTPILILGNIDESDYNIAIDNNISISVGSLSELEKLDSKILKRINIHLQINTGLNRFGLRTLNEFKKALKIISESKYINLEGVYSHFATKQNDITYINKQFLRFLQFKKRVTNDNVIFHIANSYATLHFPKYHLDMVRNGFLLYGYMDNNIGNEPVLSITSHILSIIQVKKGDTIGYDRTYRAKKPIKVAVIPMGYADGYNRQLSNNTFVIINGKKHRNVGLICMDVFMVDITGEDIRVGDKVTILGKFGGESITLKSLAESAHASPYEILCNLKYKRMNYIIKK